MASDMIQVRLRSVFIAITIVACLFAVMGRVLFLARRASFHERKAVEYSHQIMTLYPTRSHGATSAFDFKADLSPNALEAKAELWRHFQYHAGMNREYEEAIYRPWRVINESDSFGSREHLHK